MRQPWQILLVDDEHFLRQSLQRRIQELGEDFTVAAQAENGEEALSLLQEKLIHIVITDIRMPVMDGIELARQIYERYPDIITIILSGYADFSYAQSALRYGVFDYLLKPVSAEELDTALGHARMRLEPASDISDAACSGRSGAEESVHQAIAYLREHYREDIDIGTLASSLGFHSAYLTRLFNRYVGDPPLKYLTSIRIHEAQKLLTTTSLSISTIGEMVGYPDQIHFSKTFRKATGVNPSAFRRQALE